MLTDYAPSRESTSEDLCKAPENRLLLAVLQDALSTFQRGLNTTDRKLAESFREVDFWFRNRDHDSPFSFESICGTFQIDPGFVRDRLNKMRRAVFMNDVAPECASRVVLYSRRAWINRLG